MKKVLLLTTLVAHFACTAPSSNSYSYETLRADIAGFSVLDITNPEAPLHLYSVFNDDTNKFVHHVDHEGIFNKWGYTSSTYTLNTFAEAKLATSQEQKGNNDNNCKDDFNDNGELTTTCYKSKTWTFPINGVTKEDVSIKIGEDDYSDFSLSTIGSTTTITFSDDMIFQANIDETPVSTRLVVTVDKN